MLHKDCERLLYSQEEIAKRVIEVAQKIESEYQDKRLLALCVLKGASMFYADLIRHIKLPVEMGFIQISSYRNGTQSGEIQVKFADEQSYQDKDVLVVEDIVDSGNTLVFLKSYLLERGAKSVKTVTLLDKVSARKTNFQTDYACFAIENQFVVGYGLDYAEKYRNLPYVAVLSPTVYKE